MARYNNKKLQTQRNFQSIWHSQPEYIGTLLKEDQLIREYIIGTMRIPHGRPGQNSGTMKTKGWKLSEIIIKRKVKQIHIAFQIQNKIVKERKRWTKNRLKNRNSVRAGVRSGAERSKALGLVLKRTRGSQASLAVRIRLRKMALKKRFLFFQLYLMITELRKMYPNNQITFYVQKIKPLQLNANLINSWIVENIKKKKSYKRLLNRVISKFKKAQNCTRVGAQDGSFKVRTAGGYPISLLLKEEDDKKKFLSWVTGNLIYLYNVCAGAQSRDSHWKTRIGAEHFSYPLRKNPSRQKSASTSPLRGGPRRGRQMSSVAKKQLVKSSKNISGLMSNEIAKLTWPSLRQVSKNQQLSWPLKVKDGLTIGRQSFPEGKPSEKVSFEGNRPVSFVDWSTQPSNLTQNWRTRGKRQPGLINQELRSTWKLMRKVVPERTLSWGLSKEGSSKNRRRRIGYAKQHLKGVIKHRKEFNEDILLLLNYYKFNYLLSLFGRPISLNLNGSHHLTEEVAGQNIKSKFILDKNFLWQGMKFVSFIQQHPTLLDHIIKCLIFNKNRRLKTSMFSGRKTFLKGSPWGKPLLIEYLTRAWVGIFDYIYHYENSLLKGQGIRIILSGRVGYKKKGRAKKYSRYWGSLKNSSARLPLQYSYSQLHTRYGVVGVKVFVR